MKVLGKGIAAGDEAGPLFSSFRQMDLFSSLSDAQLRKVLFFVKTVEFEAGETVFEKGEPGEAFYLIHEGRVEACAPGFLGLRKVLREMGAGEFFGELALILRQPRSASIICKAPTVCFQLDRADLEMLMERSEDIAQAIKSVAKERLNDYR